MAQKGDRSIEGFVNGRFEVMGEHLSRYHEPRRKHGWKVPVERRAVPAGPWPGSARRAYDLHSGNCEGDGGSKRADAIEEGRKSHNATVGNEPVRRFEPDAAAVRRRHAHRTHGVGAERNRHQPGANNSTAAAAGATACALGVVWIETDAKELIVCCRPERSFRHIQCAYYVGARTAQRLHHRGVERGDHVSPGTDPRRPTRTADGDVGLDGDACA